MRFRSPWLPTLLIAALVALGLAGGPGAHWDVVPVEWLAAARQTHPDFERAAITLTYLGSGYVVFPVAAAGALFIGHKRNRAQAVLLVGAVLLERAAMNLLKSIVDRPRPAFNVYPVPTNGSAFPSGHSANSVTVYLLLALFLAPARYRRIAIWTAIVLCLFIGATRPILGVHWPSDVLAGWSLALLVIWFSISIANRAGLLPLEQQHEIVGRHVPSLDERETLGSG